MNFKKKFIPGFGNGKTKPTIPIEIDWDNPLTDGLYDVYLFDNQHFSSLNQNAGRTLTDATANPTTITTANNGLINLGTLPISSFSEATFIISFSNISGAGTGGRAFSCQESGFDDVRIYRSTSTSWICAWDDGSTTNQTITTGGDSEKKTFAISHDGSTQKAYYQGELKAANSDTFNFSIVGGLTYVSNRAGSTTVDINADYEYLFVFKKVVSDAVVKSLYDNPYQILKPSIETFAFVGAAAGGAITGSGTPQANAATTSASGTITKMGSGSPTAETATTTASGTVTGTVTGSGTPQSETATASGTGLRLIPGTGTPQAETATSAGSGTVSGAITGTGTPTAEAATASGVGLRIITGDASPQADTATSTAIGTITKTGSGTPQAETATSAGSGTVGDVVSGTGSPAADTATASGVGLRLISGSGSPTATTATAAGSGTITGTITGTAAVQAETATSTGVALRVITGTAAVQASTATATGTDAGYTTIHPNRIYTVEAENRTYTVEAEDRVYVA